MISFFPDVYPDELAYSWFARYGVRTGYTHYRAIADDLFSSHTAKPNLEFIIELNEDAYRTITSTMPFEQVIMKHTMFPYYTRFLPSERRQRAFSLIMRMDKTFNDAIYMRRNKTMHRQWLRYCPLCTEADRERHGETYWHRLHQLDHIKICPIHGCYLHNSSVSITSKDSPSLVHAELEIPYSFSPVFSQYLLEQKIAAYVADVFSADFTTENSVTIGQYLHRKMEYSKYVSVRGKKRNITTLSEDFFEYYKDLPRTTLTEAWQLGKIFSNHCFHTYDISLLALFLGIPSTELVKMDVSEKSQVQLFDEQILFLHNQGLNYRQIADKIGASYDFCKLVANRQRHV